MIKRTIEISQEPAHLTVRLNQLLLERRGQTIASVPCEDLGVVVVDHAGTTYSHAALCSLMASDAVLIVCGRDHLPAGILLPVADHSQIVWRIHDQIRVKRALRKQLWKQLVQAKIRAQAENLAEELPEHRLLIRLAREVRSGDPSNSEAQASRAYWRVWLTGGDLEPQTTFRRDPDGSSPNGLLNYGYAVLRAAIARALVAAGLTPALGIHHSHRANAFCLADDLIEPLRPLVDVRVRELYWAGCDEIDRSAKASLLEVLAQGVCTGEQHGPLLVGIGRMVASLVQCYEGKSLRLEIPRACK